MGAREISCTLLEKVWVTPTVMNIRFEPSRKFDFEPGQFISLVVPSPEKGHKPLRRAYSLAAPRGDAEGYRLCVKHNPGGMGTEYLKSLKIGDTFKIFAPYGEFVFEPRPDRSLCFISTGTGIAPFLAMVRSTAFQELAPPMATSIFGCRTEEEILFSQLLEDHGVKPIVALSNPRGPWAGFKGRVTDYLNSLPAEWPWATTDFYVCGNGEMVEQVKKILRGHGVVEDAIRAEVYFVAPDRYKKDAA